MKFWYDGHYDTMRGHARRRGIEPNTVEVRCHRYGNRPENYDRILKVGRVGHTTHLYRGKRVNLAELAREAGLNEATLLTRIRRGMRVEDALRKPRPNPLRTKRTRKVYAPGVIPKGSRFEYRGRIDTITGHARHLGISMDVVSLRARRFGRRYDMLDALLHKGRICSPDQLVLYRGRLDTVTAHCRRFGLSKSGVLDRINRRGFTPQESLDVALRRDGDRIRGKGLVFNGECRSLTGWARKLGLSRSCLRNRLQSGATLRQALTPGKWKKPDIKRDARSVPTRSRRGRELAALGIIL